MDGEKETLYSAFVTLDVQDPFRVSNFTLDKYHGDGGVVKIPDDKNIMYIGEEAFKDNDNITTIIIPKTVVQIHPRAFKNCSALEYVYFIDDTRLTVPESALSLIYEQAFFNCPKLKKVDLSNVKIVTVDDNAFTGCTSLTEIVDMYKMATMHDGVFSSLTYYDDDGNEKFAPACTSLASIDITGLRMTGNNVFAGCTSLKNVKTSKTTAMGYAMFKGCTKLQTITINNPVIPDDCFANCGGLTTVNFGDATASAKTTVFTVGNNAFKNCFNLANVNTNGYTLAKVGDYAFSGCESLSQFVYTGDTEFGSKVFENSPTQIIAGNGVTTENGVALYSGTTLVKVFSVNNGFTIKAGTTNIMPYAFEGATFDNVDTLVIPDTVRSLGKGALAGVKVNTVTLPQSITAIPEKAFANSEIVSIQIGKNVTSIGANAFADCLKLATIEFESNSNLKSIGDSAFARTAITNITLPDGATVMGSQVFRNCSSLQTVKLPSITQIGFFTFANCSALQTITYGDNATVVGMYNFGYNPGLSKVQNITLGSKTTVIEPFAFYGLSSLTSIDLTGVKELGEGAFAYCSKLSTVTGLSGVEVIGIGAFIDCTSLKQLDLSSATYIGASAFANNNFVDAITSVKFGDNLTYIGDYAFFGGKMPSVEITKSVNYIGSAAFANASNLNTITVDSENTNYFAEDNVLYRVFNDRYGKTKYELITYPAAKVATAGTIVIKEGTVAIKAYAAAGLNSGVATKVIIPYSVKTIGSGAFALSGIKDYTFHPITAPKLLTEIMDTGLDGFRGLTYINFETTLLSFIDLNDFSNPTSSKLIIRYPQNSNGFNNYIYTNFFGERYSLGELMDDTTRTLKESLEGFISAETVSLWLNQPVTDALKEEILAFSSQVKEAHRLLNNTSSEVQLSFLTESTDLIEKLYSIERALKPVKERFGIKMTVSSLTIDPTSTHKTNYVVGETFNINGLKLIATYDDYSQEEVDMTKASVDASYQGALTEYHRYVIVSAYGESVRVQIFVSAQPDEPIDPTPDADETEDKGGCKSTVLVGDASVVFTMIVALGVIILIRKVKRRDA
jgi:flagellar basal body rod protein FlgG